MKTQRRQEKSTCSLSQCETIYTGIGGSKGIIIGECYAFIKEKHSQEVRELNQKNVNEEIERFLGALDRSEHELKKIEQVTINKLGQNYSNLFQAQIMILHDPMLIEKVSSRIRTERKGAHIVLEEEFDHYLEKFSNSDEIIFQERADDLRDIRNRIIRNLQIRKLHSWVPQGVIVSSDNLSPADIILLSRNNVKGFVTDSGGVTSHISLICKSLNIPIVVGLGNLSQKVATGMQMIIDGSSGTVITNPTQHTIAHYQVKKDAELQRNIEDSQTAVLPAMTRCGVNITFSANIDFKEEIVKLREAGAEGVGLFRSENLFTEGTKVPPENEQYACYHEMASTLAPAPLDIRLFDIGGDKLMYSPIKEPNPNLGWRGIRILIDLPDILDAQVRAAVRANTHGNIGILIPMVISLDEIELVKKTAEKHYEYLTTELLEPVQRASIGAMIEVPAAVELIDEITRSVDFVSIGTNDLAQYSLAVDRNNSIVQDLLDKFHPAVMRQLHRIITTANANNCRVVICGDMGSDPLALPFLLGCGLRIFSVVTSDIPALKTAIARYTISDCEALTRECLTCATTQGVKTKLEHFNSALDEH